MSDRVKLSVIVMIYNVEPYLRRGIDSLIHQTYKDIEIILVNDGSTDGCGQICDEYAGKDERIAVIHKENGGIVSAIKAGLKIATGEYIILFGPDDWNEDNAFEMVIERIDQYHPDIVSFGLIKDYGDFSEEYPNIMKEGLYTNEEFWAAFHKHVRENYFFSQPMDMSQGIKAVRAELFRKHEQPVSEKLKKNVDDAMMFSTLMDMSNIYIDSRCWAHYCVRKTSILWETGQGDDDRFVRLAHHLMDSYRERGEKSPDLEKFLLYKMVHHMMLDIPEKFFSEEKCLIYPKLRKDSNIIVYGKGVFATRLIRRMKELQFANIVDNVDSKDIARLQEIQNYDYIIVAVFNARIVKSILQALDENHIQRDKILIIEKENISPEMLPEEVRKKYEEITK